MRIGLPSTAGRIVCRVVLTALLACVAAATTPAQTAQRWDGPYLGLMGVHTRSDQTGTALRGDGQVGSNASRESANAAIAGGGAGAVLGYQRRYGNGIIAGLEADWVGLRHRGRQDTLVDSNNAWFGMVGASIERETQWLSTARLRLGYGDGPWMVNATAGLALASMVQTRTQYQGVFGPTQTVARFSEQDRALPLGWTLGLGGAWRIAEGWSLRLDYLYAAFDEVRFRFPNARGGVAGAFGSVQGRDVRDDVAIHSLRLGVTYSFGHGR